MDGVIGGRARSLDQLYPLISSIFPSSVIRPKLLVFLILMIF
jgi:hypothetical protein